MTIKELRNYRTICAEIEHIDKQLGKHTVKDSVQSASKHPYSLHSVSVEGDIYEHSSPLLLIKKQKLLAQKRGIEKLICGVSEYRIRRALELYCLEPLNEDLEIPSWEDVADMFADGSTAASLKMAVKRYLEKI